MDLFLTRSGCQWRWRHSYWIVLTLFVAGIMIRTVHIHLSSSSTFFTLFAVDGNAGLKYSWKNEIPKDLHLQNEGPPPPLAQQNSRQQPTKEPKEHPHSTQRLPLKVPKKQPSNGLLKSGNQNLPKTCQPKSHIVFLKTHKTASSTVQNILFRYGESRELIFALPQNKTHMLSYPFPFSSDYVEWKHLTKFDIMCAHMRFRKSEVEKVMPNNSFYFSILRHPVPSLKSSFKYYHALKVFRNFTTLDDFLDKGKNEKSLKDFIAHNNVAFDFGYNNTFTADTSDLETIVSEMIAGIERDFHLILITEYFDESMILLKHALCWSLEDVVSFKLNSHTDQSHLSLSPVTPEKIRRWNVLDWRIYEHFNATFWQNLRNVVGEEKMKLEVSELRKLQAKLMGTCLDGGHAVDPQLIKDDALKPYQPPGVIVQGFNLKPDLDNQTYKMCQRMATPELVYTLHLYKKQFENIQQKQSSSTAKDNSDKKEKSQPF